ncbi:MAG: palindromic element RPE1 domain-containing protein [Holosporales bacterium]|nr:palindromic element RPE1 domain-containing protein [Holosporales bacterium]
MRPLSKPPESELLEGNTEHRTAAYLDVREDSSTVSTKQKNGYVDLGMDIKKGYPRAR